MKLISKIIAIFFLCSCATFGQGLPKLAQAASLVCDSLKTYDQFVSQVEEIKQLVEDGNYKVALEQSQNLYDQYKDFPNSEGLQELKSLISLLKQLA